MQEHTATTQHRHDETKHTLTIIDLQILAELRDDPLWKKRIAHQIDNVSIQTIGRRVDALRDKGLLDSCIIAPDDIKRDLIIAFETTEQGRAALQTHLVCSDPDCENLKRPDEHVHDHVPAGDYF